MSRKARARRMKRKCEYQVSKIESKSKPTEGGDAVKITNGRSKPVKLLSLPELVPISKEEKCTENISNMRRV
jgi:hypothetical protein